LVGYCFAFLSLNSDKDFARIEAINFARERDHLNAIQVSVGLIVANDNSWPGLTDLAAD